MLLIHATLICLRLYGIHAFFYISNQPWESLSSPQLNFAYFSPYYGQAFPKIPVPVYGQSSNFPYNTLLPLFSQPLNLSKTLSLSTTFLQNLTPTSSLVANSSILLSKRNEYVGHVTEIKPINNGTKLNYTSKKNDISEDKRLYVPDFLHNTSDEVKNKFYEIVSNPYESFQQKQSKLDQLVFVLSNETWKMYNQYQEKKDLEERRRRKRIHDVVASMSEKAQSVFSKVLFCTII
ncbi:unnamed protein product [Thelazia callipaeda]|uniref:SXP/RAL-2 family protein Ani s 5-like cation-binding domain-containing protein n=1 Tax=Thelazia callipaeda TaxID=103827 RepID=A0A0N5CLB5_THECL|nr:unnamed protein product [Thelazia callipaeda]